MSSSENFCANFKNEKTGVERKFIFSLQQYIQARMWMTAPAKESASELAAWLNESNTNRQAAYCAVQVWREQLREKGAH